MARMSVVPLLTPNSGTRTESQPEENELPAVRGMFLMPLADARFGIGA
jgi:hypothetical protein